MCSRVTKMNRSGKSLDIRPKEHSNARHLVIQGPLSIKSAKAWIGNCVTLHALLDDDAILHLGHKAHIKLVASTLRSAYDATFSPATKYRVISFHKCSGRQLALVVDTACVDYDQEQQHRTPTHNPPLTTIRQNMHQNINGRWHSNIQRTFISINDNARCFR